ncbi:hypothetical protein [Streptomyces fulvoviolaceus]|uniref:hypothetical protein n=1 Tax=Streptomyces fulvoviolaceus TaxID=285535 RepID=UPI000AA6CB68|nr:hypothetical protein [Streptomyces fulvoviolaceus]
MAASVAAGAGLLAVAPAGSAAATEPVPGSVQSEPVVTASSVAALGGDFSSVEPFVVELDRSWCASLHNADGPVGYFGPIGAWGPLSDLGPLGRDLPAAFNWSDYASWLTAWGGPMRDSGPLGSGGPLAAYNRPIQWFPPQPGGPHNFAPCGVQLKTGGTSAALGPLGPLGPVGPLGPLGPRGGHLCPAGADGSYLCGAEEVPTRTYVAGGREGQDRPYSLFEKYTKAFAQSLNDKVGDEANDTSFMVTTTPQDDETAGGTDTYTFTSPETVRGVAQASQWLTVVVTPTGMRPDQWATRTEPADYRLTLRDENTGRVVATSDADDRVNWIQVRVPAGARLTAAVTLRDSRGLAHPGYNLTVTGSTDQFQYIGCNPALAASDDTDTYIRGDHLRMTLIQGTSTVGTPPACGYFSPGFDSPIG